MRRSKKHWVRLVGVALAIFLLNCYNEKGFSFNIEDAGVQYGLFLALTVIACGSFVQPLILAVAQYFRKRKMYN
ncbi:hypothetical protein [Lacticaseibacillus hulanensis]|jgi:hypothetical protein|uniref:hypothetical protein n=1 Tax=Lacticaseibacillus hulanensis TaxID=2493111 RepID=UPI000FD7B175|nr:hypothetical protein [Lacticaseibacillus hulanensis]